MKKRFTYELYTGLGVEDVDIKVADVTREKAIEMMNTKYYSGQKEIEKVENRIINQYLDGSVSQPVEVVVVITLKQKQQEKEHHFNKQAKSVIRGINQLFQ